MACVLLHGKSPKQNVLIFFFLTVTSTNPEKTKMWISVFLPHFLPLFLQHWKGELGALQKLPSAKWEYSHLSSQWGLARLNEQRSVTLAPNF